LIGKYDIPRELFTDYDNADRRRHDEKLFKRGFRLDLGKYVLQQQSCEKLELTLCRLREL